jgi:hypothetical protein
MHPNRRMLLEQLDLADIRRPSVSPWWPLPECHQTSIDESRGSRSTSAMISRSANRSSAAVAEPDGKSAHVGRADRYGWRNAGFVAISFLPFWR